MPDRPTPVPIAPTQPDWGPFPFRDHGGPIFTEADLDGPLSILARLLEDVLKPGDNGLNGIAVLDPLHMRDVSWERRLALFRRLHDERVVRFVVRDVRKVVCMEDLCLADHVETTVSLFVDYGRWYGYLNDRKRLREE